MSAKPWLEISFFRVAVGYHLECVRLAVRIEFQYRSGHIVCMVEVSDK